MKLRDLLNRRTYRTPILRSLSALALLGCLIWLLGSEPAAQALAQIIARVSNGQIVISGVTGSIFDALSIKRIDWVTPEKTVTLQRLQLAWSPRQLWDAHRLQLTRLNLAALDITLKQPDNKPLQMPSSLQLPFDLSIPNGRINAVRIHRGGQHLIIQPVTFTLNYAKHRYALSGTALSEWGNAQLQAQLTDQLPYKLNSQIGLTLHDGIHNYDVATRLDGTLARIQLNSTAKSGKANATARAQLTPFLAQPLAQASISVSNFNPADIGYALPHARIDGQANITPTGTGTYSGAIHLGNRASGSLDKNMLPFARLDADIIGTTANLTLTNLTLLLSHNGRIFGSGKWHDNGLDLHLRAQQIDLNALYQPLHATHLGGKLDMSMNAQRQTLNATLNQANYNMDLAATYQQQRLTITSAKLRKDTSTLTLTGELTLTGTRKFSAQGALSRFNPAQFGRYPVASINAEFNTQGQMQPQLQTRLQLAISNSRYNNAALSGHAALLIAKQRLWNSNAQFQLGHNTLSLQGSFGAAHDRMAWQLNAPSIAVLGTGFSGKLIANGALYGSFAQPAGELNAQGEQLALQSGLHIGRIDTHIKIGQGSDADINASGNLSDFQAGGIQVDSAYIHASGTRQKHTLTLVTKSNALDLNATLTGSWRNQTWRGQISQLVNREPYPLTLRAPAPLTISRGHVLLNHAEFSVANGLLNLDQFEYGMAGINSRGSASGLDMGYILQRLHPDAQITNTLSAGGKWQFTLAHDLNGEIMLWRERGDIGITGIQTVHLGINRAQLTVQAENSRVTARLDASGSTLGDLSAQADTTLTHSDRKLVFSTLSPLHAHAQLHIPSLAWTTAAFDDTFNLDGALQAQFDLQGSLHAPAFSGTINGSQLVLGYPEQGIHLQNGILHAQFDHDSLNITQLDFHAGGELNAHGIIRLNDGKPDIQLTASARQLNLVNRPDRQITLSGQADVTARDRHLTTQADISIDRAMLSLNDDSTPHLSDDVIVIGRTVNRSKTRSNTDTPAWLADSQINIALGKHTRVKGQGLDARLEGSLKLNQHGTKLPTASGTVTIVEGTYNAFGQRLDITRGILNFAGAVNNPGLDILATRTNPTVTAGVQVSGTARLPSVKLVSTPDLTDNEKLSWLVLGHGTTTVSNNADTKALQAAASYLLGKNDSMSLQSKLTELTGLNDISLNSAGTLDSSVLSLGKRLSDQLYLNYEQGLTGAKQLVKITYNLSRRMSVRAQGGNESALDLFYTFSFD